MATRRMKIADLDDEGVKRVRQMEEAFGTLILALEPSYPLAELSQEQISKLQELENELGVVLLAFKS